MSTPRTRTAPEVKWVANELAAVNGELSRIDAEQERLTTRKAELDARRAALEQVAVMLRVPELPKLGLSVRPHDRYGERGALRAWVEALLQATAPEAVDTRTMTDLAAEHFRFDLPTPAARKRFMDNTLVRQLRVLRDEGLAERIAVRGSALGRGGSVAGQAGLWRWKATLPTFAELQALRDREVELAPPSEGFTDVERPGDAAWR